MDTYNSLLTDYNEQPEFLINSKNFSNIFSKAVLEQNYQRSLCKGHGTFTHVLALMKAAESEMNRIESGM
jgi:hypothetical protein